MRRVGNDSRRKTIQTEFTLGDFAVTDAEEQQRLSEGENNVRLTDEQEMRFWSKVKRDGSGCWIWQGATQSRGYGSFGINGKTYNAHRIAWMLANGRMPEPGMFILHRCDNRRCVNPRHLREGTHEENMQDMHSRGRGYIPTPKRKLTPKQVAAIRVMKGTQEKIAAKFGVHPSLVSQIKRGKAHNS